MGSFQNIGRSLVLMVNKERYVENAKEILSLLKKYPDYCPSMGAFASTKDGISIINLKKIKECGTSFCLAGLQAVEDNFPSEYVWGSGDSREFNFTWYSKDKMGIDDETIDTLSNVYWDFVYDATWPNTRESAIKRLNYIIENGDMPPVNLWREFK